MHDSRERASHRYRRAQRQYVPYLRSISPPKRRYRPFGGEIVLVYGALKYPSPTSVQEVSGGEADLK